VSIAPLTADERLEAAAELACTRVGLGFSLSAIARSENWVAWGMLEDELSRCVGHDATLRSLAFVASEQLRDRLCGELAFSAAAALAVLDAGQT
jgi:hypothetical protein